VSCVYCFVHFVTMIWYPVQWSG